MLPLQRCSERVLLGIWRRSSIGAHSNSVIYRISNFGTVWKIHICGQYGFSSFWLSQFYATYGERVAELGKPAKLILPTKKHFRMYTTTIVQQKLPKQKWFSYWQRTSHLLDKKVAKRTGALWIKMLYLLSAFL